MTIFDGYAFAQEREATLARRLAVLAPPLGTHGPILPIGNLHPAGGKYAHPGLQIAAILFAEDKGSQLYTGLKQQAAERVGIEYHVYTFSILDPLEKVLSQLELLNADPAVTGIIIQKPWRKTWENVVAVASGASSAADFTTWWQSLVTHISLAKDVDGLHPETLAAIKAGTWKKDGRVMPATAKAVLSILKTSGNLRPGKYLIIGKSDILGLPLAYELTNLGFDVELLGRKELAARQADGRLLKDADVVISATGQEKIITGDLLKNGAVVIDVGEPRPDVDRESVEKVAEFLTPVPGGVGPVTVVSLLENVVELSLEIKQELQTSS